ncbi:MAG: hypothetical protein ACPG4Z_02325 [Chitinophagales bacterium]
MKRSFFPALLVALGFVSMTTSCKDEEVNCYRCSYTYTYYGQTYTDTYTYCLHEFTSREVFESYIDYLRSEGYDCDAAD